MDIWYSVVEFSAGMVERIRGEENAKNFCSCLSQNIPGGISEMSHLSLSAVPPDCAQDSQVLHVICCDGPYKLG